MVERKKVYIVFSAFCLFFFFVLCKAFYVQVINSKKLKNYSNSQFLRESKLYPNRGNIYDRYGEPLAINIHRYSVFAIPKLMEKGENNYEKINEIIPNLSIQAIEKRIKNRKKFTWLARKIPLTKDQLLEIKKLKGVFTEEESRRFYPNHELAAQILGFVGVDNVGLSGIEHQFNKELKGEAQIVKYYQDAKGRPIKYETTDHQGRGKDIHLSIDKDLQAKAEKYLKEAVLEKKAIKGGIGVMDADTGELLAMANYPSFDPNSSKYVKGEDRKLSFISDPFEPGSIFKVLTVASALEHNVARKDSNYYCERGRFKIGNHFIKEAGDHKAHEWLSVEDILKYSSNIGVTKIAFDLKFPRLKKTLLDFNINQKSGIELPGESRGIFTDKDNISPLALSNISFGQGIATTGIQMLAAYAAVANGGYYVQPTIIKRSDPTAIEKKKILSKDVAEQLTDMLVKVVEDGTGFNAKITYNKIAGKTSTAQKANVDGGYKGYIGGFVGFPVGGDKKIVIFVYIDEPSGKEYYGNAVAGPVFKKMALYWLYKNKEFTNNEIVADAEQNQTGLDKVQIKYSGQSRIGDGKSVPNFIGLDKTSVNKLIEKSDLKVVHNGFGIVVDQKPKFGTELGNETIVQLFYQAPSYE